MSTIIFDVDTQKDFMTQGVSSSYIWGQDYIKFNISKILVHAMRNRMLIAGTVNVFELDTFDEFDNEEPHCIIGTDGCEKAPDTIVVDSEFFYTVPCLRHGIEIEVSKECWQVYFEKSEIDIWGELGQSDNLMTFLRYEHVTDVIIIGVNDNHSIDKAIDGFIKNKFNVTVISDAVMVDDEFIPFNGVDVMTTEDYLLTKGGIDG